MPITTTIEQDWTGYVLPHLLDLSHEHYRNGDFFPGSVDNWVENWKIFCHSMENFYEVFYCPKMCSSELCIFFKMNSEPNFFYLYR